MNVVGYAWKIGSVINFLGKSIQKSGFLTAELSECSVIFMLNLKKETKICNVFWMYCNAELPFVEYF